MSTTDPRVLIPLLEDLQQGLSRGTLECRKSVADADRAQQHLVEHGARLAARVRGLAALADEDERLARQTLQAVEAAEARAQDAAVRSAQVLAQSRRVWGKADRTRDHWRAEVERASLRVAAAQAWVAQAKAAVAAATHRVNIAAAALDSARRRVAAAADQVAACEQEVVYAQSQLAAAQAALAQCLQPVYYTDSEGRQQVAHNDCSGCYAAVAQAQQALAAARSYLDSAQWELAAARSARAAAEQELAAAEAQLAAARADLANACAELAAAERDLRQCQANLAKAEHAVRVATAAVQRAEMAGATAAEAVEAAAASRIPAERAAELNVLQKERCAQLDALSRQVDGSLQQGEGEVRQAHCHGDAAADGVRACNNDLSLRVDHLQALERPHDFT